LITEGKLS